MRDKIPPNIIKHRRIHPHYELVAEDSIEGYFEIPYADEILKVISGCGEGWDHVSVSLGLKISIFASGPIPMRTPNWEEMCFIKNIFWASHELVFQLHPPASEYVNKSPFVLHLWKPWNYNFKLPPRWMI